MVEPLNADVRSRMSSQRTTGTKPELAVRRILHQRGLRYRVGIRPELGIRTTGDLVFTKAKVVVFIDGCFWHGCPDHFIPPKNNAEWWAAKIDTNRRRDGSSRSDLEALGWSVLSFWEHELPLEVASVIERLVRAPRA